MKWNGINREKREWRLTTLKLCAFPSFGISYVTRYFLLKFSIKSLTVSTSPSLWEEKNNGQYRAGTCKADRKRSHHRRRVVEDEINDETIFMFFIRKHSRWFGGKEELKPPGDERNPRALLYLMTRWHYFVIRSFHHFEQRSLSLSASPTFFIFFFQFDSRLFIITLTLLCYTRSFSSISERWKSAYSQYDAFVFKT